ncbi:hypothetical protein V5799_008458 [Amblyomma americanum]|uniref:Uncharacterized protein n=1 Tax=Amblyomma americanum TaxID=6943 RepID=A0AAQ4FEN4_AMBAM
MGDVTAPDISRVVDEDLYEYTRRECGGIHIMKKMKPAHEDFNSAEFDAFDGLTFRVYIRSANPQAE